MAWHGFQPLMLPAAYPIADQSAGAAKVKVAGTARGCSCDRRRDVPHDRHGTRGASTKASQSEWRAATIQTTL